PAPGRVCGLCGPDHLFKLPPYNKLKAAGIGLSPRIFRRKKPGEYIWKKSVRVCLIGTERNEFRTATAWLSYLTRPTTRAGQFRCAMVRKGNMVVSSPSSEKLAIPLISAICFTTSFHPRRILAKQLL